MPNIEPQKIKTCCIPVIASRLQARKAS